MSLTREHRITRRESEHQDGQDLTVDMAFASDLPYERWWGVEILDCRAECVDLSRLNDGGPILYNHNWDALRGHHVAGSVIADGSTVRGQVVLSWAADDGKTIKMVQGSHLTKASIGWAIAM